MRAHRTRTQQDAQGRLPFSSVTTTLTVLHPTGRRGPVDDRVHARRRTFRQVTHRPSAAPVLTGRVASAFGDVRNGSETLERNPAGNQSRPGKAWPAAGSEPCAVSGNAGDEA